MRTRTHFRPPAVHYVVQGSESAPRVPLFSMCTLERTLECPPSTQCFRRRWFTAGGVRLSAMRAALPTASASNRIESVPRARPDCVGQQLRRIGRSSSHRTRGRPPAGVGRRGAAACCNSARQVCATTKATDAVASPSLLLLRFTSCLSIPLRPLTSSGKLSKLLLASRSSATGHTSQW